MELDELIEWARQESESLLSPLGDRWTHTRAVARAAQTLARVDQAIDGPVLIGAAFLHDVGYAPALRHTGHHALDGAAFLAARGHERLSVLVANHSGARYEAALLDLTARLDDCPAESSPTADALTYCDLVTDHIGNRVTLAQRFDDVRARYGESHLVARAMMQALPELERTVRRVEARVAAVRR